MLPAMSVWRAMTVLEPSPTSVRLEPLPVLQLVPPSVLYCQEAPDSMPLMLTRPLLVMASLADEPVSAESARVGALKAVVSMVTLKAGEVGETSNPGLPLSVMVAVRP